MWLQSNGAPKVPVLKHNRDNILIICKQHVIMLMMTTMAITYPCNTQSADHNSNVSSRITVRNRSKPKSKFHVITKIIKFFYYEARYFSGNSGYPLRFRTRISGVKTEEFVIFFTFLVYCRCCAGDEGQLGEQIKQELGRLNLRDIRWTGRKNGDGKWWV